MPTPKPISYIDALLDELAGLEGEYVEIIEASEIRYVNPNTGGGVFFVGAADWGWASSDDALTGRRMRLLRRVRDWAPRFRLLFPHPTPEVVKRLKDDVGLLERWLERPGHFDHDIPRDTALAAKRMTAAVQQLGQMRDLLPNDDWPVRLAIDTNALIDYPDLTIYTSEVGTRYLVHIFPVVLREIDNLKRSGRTSELREAAKKADRRLKGHRDNGDVRTGARVAGDVYVVFEHIEPQAEGLPDWLDMGVPDDRFAASALRLQSQHPGARLIVGTSDINLQTKLAAIGLPFIEPPAV